MIDISDWVQKNWFQLGSLLVQCATLAILTWYGSKMLRFLRAFFDYQDQFRERLLVSLATGASSGGRVAAAWHDVIRWLQEPMGSGGVGPFRKIVKWLQAPMGS